jgi:hypothetical protein
MSFAFAFALWVVKDTVGFVQASAQADGRTFADSWCQLVQAALSTLFNSITFQLLEKRAIFPTPHQGGGGG